MLLFNFQNKIKGSMKKQVQKTSLWLGFSLSFILGAFLSKSLDDRAITAQVVKEAEKLMGLEFSTAEVDSMLGGLEEQRVNFENNRKISIDNSVAPALVFDPIPPGHTLEIPDQGFRWDELAQVKMPKNRDELAFYTIRELASLLKNQQITSVALTEFFLDRLKKFDPQLHCVITLTEDLALKQAQRADEEIKAGNYRGPLHGIPYGIKDLLATKNYKTTWGATPFQNQMIDQDAAVVKKLEEAGAVLVAKLTMGALAWGDVWFGGMTRNPWNTEQGSSGSSAGSASAVSAGLVPFAIGTETLGSIVSPSTVCGVTGLRPTFGRVSRAGAMALSWSMDKIGPLCRDAEDAILVLNHIYGPDGEDLSVKDLPLNYDANQSLSSYKIGYLKKDFERDYRFKENDEKALEKFRSLGIELIPIELPALPDISFVLWVEAATAFDELTRSGQDDQLVRQVKRAWPNFFRQSRFIPAVEYLQANRLRTQLMQEMAQMMEKVDMFITPSWASSSLTMTNLTGHPCVVMPNGFDQRGNPTSITIVGDLYEEGKMIRLAKAFQEVTDFHQEHPQLKP